MNAFDDASPRTILKHVLVTGKQKSVVRHQPKRRRSNDETKFALKEVRRINRKSMDLVSPAMSIKSKMKENIRRSAGEAEFITPGPINVPRKNSAHKTSKAKRMFPVVLPRTSKDELDDETPRTLLRNIIRTEPETSLLIPKRPVDVVEKEVQCESGSETSSSSSVSLDKILPGIVSEDNSLMPSNTGRLGRKRRRRKKKINISQFLSPDERDAPSNVVPGPADMSAGSSFGGISLSVPDPEKSILKPGLKRRPKKRKIISVEDFEQAVHQELQNLHSQDKGATESQVAFSDKSTAGLVAFPMDIILSNTELFIQPAAQLLSPSSSSVSAVKNASNTSDTQKAADSVFKPASMRNRISMHNLISSSDPVLEVPKVTTDHQLEISVAALENSRNIGDVTGYITGTDSAPANQADTDKCISPSKGYLLTQMYFKRSEVQGPSGHSSSVMGSTGKNTEVHIPSSDTVSPVRRSRRIEGIQGPEIHSPISRNISRVSNTVFDVREPERGSDSVLGNSRNTAEIQDPLAESSSLSGHPRRSTNIQYTPGSFNLVHGSQMNIAEIQSPVNNTTLVPKHSRRSDVDTGSSNVIPGSPRTKTHSPTGEIVLRQRCSTTPANIQRTNDGLDSIPGDPRNITESQDPIIKSLSRLSQSAANVKELLGRTQSRRTADLQEPEVQDPVSKIMSRSSDTTFNVQVCESGSSSVSGSPRNTDEIQGLVHETSSVLRHSRRTADAQEHFDGSDSLLESPRNVTKIHGFVNEPSSLPGTAQKAADAQIPTDESTSVPGSPFVIAEVHGPVYNTALVPRQSRTPAAFKGSCDETHLVPKSSRKSAEVQSPVCKTVLSPGHSRKTASLPKSIGSYGSLSRSTRKHTEVQRPSTNTISTPRNFRMIDDGHSPFSDTEIAPGSFRNVVDQRSPEVTLRQKLSVKVLNFPQQILVNDSVSGSPNSSTGVENSGTGVVSAKHLASQRSSHDLDLAAKSSRSSLGAHTPRSGRPQHSNRTATPRNSIHGSGPVLRSPRLNLEVHSPIKSKVSSPRHSTTSSNLQNPTIVSRMDSLSLVLISAPVSEKAQGENLELENEHTESRHAALNTSVGKGSGNVVEVVSRNSTVTSMFTGDMQRTEELDNSVFLASEGHGELGIQSFSDRVSESVSRTDVAHGVERVEGDQQFSAKEKLAQFNKLLKTVADEISIGTEEGSDKMAASEGHDVPLGTPSSLKRLSGSINKPFGAFAAERVENEQEFPKKGESEVDKRQKILEDEAIIIPENMEQSEEAEEEQETTSDVTEAESDECSLNRPVFLQMHQASSPVLATPHFLKTPLSIVPKQATVPKKETCRRVQKIAKEEPHLPKSLIKSIFAHYAKVKVSRDACAAVERCVELYLQQVCKDLDVFANHAKRRTIEKEDVELLLKRQGHVSDKVPLNVLIERHLPLEYRKLLIPAAVSGNKIIPEK